MKTPKNKITLVLLWSLCLFGPHLLEHAAILRGSQLIHSASRFGPVVDFVIWIAMFAIVAAPLLRTWSSYPGRVSLLEVFQGLIGTHAGTPLFLISVAAVTTLILIDSLSRFTTDFMWCGEAFLAAVWIYVTLSIGAVYSKVHGRSPN